MINFKKLCRACPISLKKSLERILTRSLKKCTSEGVAYLNSSLPTTTSTIGVFRQGVFYSRNTNSAGNADNVFSYGAVSDTPLAGDWTGQGKDTVGVFQQGVFYLKNNNSAGNADNVFSYGADSDTPVEGIWI